LASGVTSQKEKCHCSASTCYYSGKVGKRVAQYSIALALEAASLRPRFGTRMAFTSLPLLCFATKAQQASRPRHAPHAPSFQRSASQRTGQPRQTRLFYSLQNIRQLRILEKINYKFSQQNIILILLDLYLKKFPTV
jgi:hypothetical protein